MNLTSRSPEETESIGLWIGRRLRDGSTVALHGELGAGKTTLVRGMAQAFGIDGRDVSSPSFSIIVEYPGAVRFCHVDLYRTGGDEDLEGTGFWETVGGVGITVIEWAEKAGARLPSNTITVSLRATADDVREIEIVGLDEEDRDHM